MTHSKQNFPEILSRDGGALSLRIPKDLPYFEGHFPNLPIVAGVVQLHWAIRLAQEIFSLPRGTTDCSQIKFSQLMRPLDELKLVFEHDSEKKMVLYKYQDDEKTYSSGRFTYG